MYPNFLGVEILSKQLKVRAIPVNIKLKKKSDTTNLIM